MEVYKLAADVEKYFKKKMDQIVFVNLSDKFVDKHAVLRYLKGIPIPVMLAVVEEEAKRNGGRGSFSPAAAAQAMIYVIGADENFPYANQYMHFLHDSISGARMSILSQGLECTGSGDMMRAAILFRAAYIYERWEVKNEAPKNTLLINTRKVENADALFNYARACRDIYMDENEEDEAKKVAFREESVRKMEECIKEFPDFDQAYYYLGFFYMNKKRYEEAKELWTKFLSISELEPMKEDVRERMDQVDDLILYEKGTLEVMNERPQEGLDILLPLYEKYKEWWNLLFFIGLAYRKLGQFEIAVPFFQEVLRLKPSQGDSCNELGLCYASLQDFDNAEKYFKKAALVDQKDPELLCNLAAVYINTGRLDEAEKLLDEAEKMAPGEGITAMWRAELEKLK